MRCGGGCMRRRARASRKASVGGPGGASARGPMAASRGGDTLCGIGSETQRPFAVVIVGGIITATIFTLVLLPLLYPYTVREESVAAPEAAAPLAHS